MKPRVVLPMIVDESSMQFEDKLVIGLFSALIDRKLTVLKFIPQIKTFRKATLLSSFARSSNQIPDNCSQT